MRRRRILVVEDQLSQASAIERTLSASGYEVRTVGDGKTGVDAAVEWLPDAILMDVRMPVMNGLVATSMIRRDPRTRGVPVVAITARSRPEDYLHGLLAGFNKYLTKPYTNEELLELIAEVFRHADYRAKVEALTPARRELDELLEIRGDREQIFTALLAAVRGVVDCDFLALQWRRADADEALIVARAAGLAPALVERIRDAVTLAGDRRPAETALVICAGETPALEDRAITAGFDVPLSHGDEGVGVLYVGSLTRDRFDRDDEQTLGSLSSALARVCASGLDIGPTSDPCAATLVHEIHVLLVLDDADRADAWARRVEASIPGLCVHADTAALAALDAEPDFHMVLVSPGLRETVEQTMFARARAGANAYPVLELDPAVVGDSEAAICAFFFMALLISFMDAQRSGCLHVGTKAGPRTSGLIVFHEGRIAWASSSGGDASFLAFLARRADGSRDALRRAIATSARERRNIAEVLRRDGLISETGFRAALKDYIVAVLSELLRLERPSLWFSRQIVATPHNESFAVDDITLEVF